jgi:quercetin dioxygenase-like cupin family protein
VAALTVTTLDGVATSPEYAAPRRATGVQWSRRVSPGDYSTWMAVSELADGGIVEWDAGATPHGDDGVYVLSGALDVEAGGDVHRCPAGGALIVESRIVGSGAAAVARAAGPTTIVHCGPRDATPPADGLYGPPAADGHGVHVLGPDGWFRSGDRERVVATWFADSTCPTCRISFFHVWRGEGGIKDRSHTHTQDELIYVVGGSLVVGGVEHGLGSCLAVPANVRYSVTSGPDGNAFLNYRRDVSVQGYLPGEPTELEGALARGGVEVADFR